MTTALKDIVDAFATIAPTEWASFFEKDPVISLDTTGCFVIVEYVIAGPTRVMPVSHRMPIIGSAEIMANRIFSAIQADVKLHLK